MYIYIYTIRLRHQQSIRHKPLGAVPAEILQGLSPRWPKSFETNWGIQRVWLVRCVRLFSCAGRTSAGKEFHKKHPSMIICPRDY